MLIHFPKGFQITVYNIWVKCTSSTRTRRGGSCLRDIYNIRPFSSIELACAVRQPGPCVRALCQAVAQMLSRNMTYMCNPGARQRQAKTFRTLHTALFALHTPHFTLALHTSSHLKACELFSPHLSSSHLIPPLLTCHQSKSTVFISSEH